ncbi:M20 metallopeptidase family protein [Calditerricola satsumensis]|uniref:N-acyl-L-amino acid amidohydrolase n=1 Tax=Calditerricola satsumensis TaxID=373054 RepID=A0A8J3B772_9BACI|nr:amidohydrolase [Calditerricola satsumensis]GGK00749.1 N-acyl-L-amino acid amidohydrolase [Calditerricola satsumensis]
MTSKWLWGDPRLQEWTVAVRRHLHAHPELSHEEVETARFVREQLESWGVETTAYGNNHVIGYVRGARPGRTVALRADLDALPVQEETGLPFASTRPGVMHACGHDGHTAILLTAARILAERRAELAGTVKVIFQHAEETVPGGARFLVEQGVLDDVDAIFGLHLWQPQAKGTVGVKAGPLMAAADKFTVRIQGKGGHGSMPHETVDPVVVAAAVIQNLQTVVSRNVSPLEPAVVSVGSVQAGEGYNVIPDSATLAGTVRTFREPVRRLIAERLRRVVDGVCAAYGATAEVAYTFGDPAVVNDPVMADLVRRVAEQVVGPDRVVEAEPSMGGEDFAYYLQQKPGCFFFIGMKGDVARYPHHHPRFTLDEDVLPIGVQMMVGVALAYLAARPG